MARQLQLFLPKSGILILRSAQWRKSDNFWLKNITFRPFLGNLDASTSDRRENGWNRLAMVDLGGVAKFLIINFKKI